MSGREYVYPAPDSAKLHYANDLICCKKIKYYYKRVKPAFSGRSRINDGSDGRKLDAECRTLARFRFLDKYFSSVVFLYDPLYQC